MSAKKGAGQVSADQTVLVEVTGAIAELTLNRPAQRNAVNRRMLDELLGAFQLAESDAAVRVVLIRGAGAAFCAGNDLKERSTMTVDELRERRTKGQATFAAIEQFSKPCIAVVHGPAIAAGSEIALASDIIIAGASASFRYPVSVRGSLSDALRLPRVVGKNMAKELLFSGRPVGAEEALRIGMVNRVVPDDTLLDSARELAALIAEHPPEAMAAIKHVINEGKITDTTRALNLEQAAIDAAIAFQDQRASRAND